MCNGMRNTFGGDRIAHDSRRWDGAPARLEIQVYSDLYDGQQASIVLGRVSSYSRRPQVIDAQDRADDGFGSIVVDQNTYSDSSLSICLFRVAGQRYDVATYAMRCRDSWARWTRPGRHRRRPGG